MNSKVNCKSERLIRDEGTAESTWRAWEGMAAIAHLDLGLWLPAAARLVVVAPHPDDEVLASGGLLAMHAAQGGAVLIVAVTDGEASHAGSRLWPARWLAPARRAESAEGQARLGLRNQELCRLALPDGAVPAHAARLEARLRRLLRPGDRVISTWRLDGHPDHEVTGLATARASSECGCRYLEAPVWMWHWAVPGDARVPWQRLRRYPVSTQARLQKIRALQAHATQLAPRDGVAGPVLGASMVQRLARAHEYFFV